MGFCNNEARTGMVIFDLPLSSGFVQFFFDKAANLWFLD